MSGTWRLISPRWGLLAFRHADPGLQPGL